MEAISSRSDRDSNLPEYYEVCTEALSLACMGSDLFSNLHTSKLLISTPLIGKYPTQNMTSQKSQITVQS